MEMLPQTMEIERQAQIKIDDTVEMQKRNKEVKQFRGHLDGKRGWIKEKKDRGDKSDGNNSKGKRLDKKEVQIELGHEQRDSDYQWKENPVKEYSGAEAQKEMLSQLKEEKRERNPIEAKDLFELIRQEIDNKQSNRERRHRSFSYSNPQRNRRREKDRSSSETNSSNLRSQEHHKPHADNQAGTKQQESKSIRSSHDSQSNFSEPNGSNSNRAVSLSQVNTNADDSVQQSSVVLKKQKKKDKKKEEPKLRPISEIVNKWGGKHNNKKELSIFALISGGTFVFLFVKRKLNAVKRITKAIRRLWNGKVDN